MSNPPLSLLNSYGLPLRPAGGDLLLELIARAPAEAAALEHVVKAFSEELAKMRKFTASYRMSKLLLDASHARAVVFVGYSHNGRRGQLALIFHEDPDRSGLCCIAGCNALTHDLDQMILEFIQILQQTMGVSV